MTREHIVHRIDELLPTCTEQQAADALNRQGHRSGTGQPFTARIVGNIRRKYKLLTRYQHLQQAGMLTLTEMAQRLSVNPQTVKIWRQHGLLTGHLYNDKNEYLYEPIKDGGPVKQQGIRLAERAHAAKVLPNPTHEVHREA